ncbi:hypothetical protein AB2N04_10990 [Nitratireductor sp. GISD-1A_MAKvit]|uniref:DUF7507 domain-containing protein n=1 Tax=Nitratireductor sp. GISD-1A_MAKvit TaxID=3234198 RepID=UPI003466145B
MRHLALYFRALLFWLVIGLGAVYQSGTALAQSIPPTSPCDVGADRTPSGWFKQVGSPDCSDQVKWGFGEFPWLNGPLPGLPTGDDTFTTMYGGSGHYEAISTNITGLVPGRKYEIPFFGITRGTDSRSYRNRCTGLVLKLGNRANQRFPTGSSAWEQKKLTFTAGAASERLLVSVYYGGSGNCVANFALGTSPIDVIKTAKLEGEGAGDTITFTMTVENTGVETLTGVAIDQDILERKDGTSLNLTTPPVWVSNSGSSAAGTLVPGERATFTATYKLVQEDIDAGGVTNQAVGIGISPTIGEVSAYSRSEAGKDQSPTVVDIARAPSISLTKTAEYEDANGNGELDAGDRIRFRFSVENDGNTRLRNITIEDRQGACGRSHVSLAGSGGKI